MLKRLMGLILAPLILLTSQGWAENRQEALEEMHALIEKNHGRIEAIDKSIREGLMNLRDLKINQNEVDPRKFGSMEKGLESLSLQRREHLLRQDFLDRLSFQVDRHFQGGDLRKFLEVKILKMAQGELSSSQPDTNMWKFLSYLSLALKELPERHEAPFAFIEGYMRFSTLLNPTRPTDYMSKRNYTNGMDFEEAEPMSADRVGEVVEEKIKEIQSRNQQDSLSFEDRKPYLKPISQMYEESRKKLDPPAPEIEIEMPQALESPRLILPESSPESSPIETATPSNAGSEVNSSGGEMKVRLIPKDQR